MTLPHLIPHPEEVSSDKEWLIPYYQPERVVVLGQVKLQPLLVRLDKIVWKKVPRQTHVEKVIANWLQQHLRCSISSHTTKIPTRGPSSLTPREIFEGQTIWEMANNFLAPEGLFGFLHEKIYSQSSRHSHFFIFVPVWVLIYASHLLFVSHTSKPPSSYQHVIRAGRPKHVVQKKINKLSN